MYYLLVPEYFYLTPASRDTFISEVFLDRGCSEFVLATDPLNRDSTLWSRREVRAGCRRGGGDQ